MDKPKDAADIFHWGMNIHITPGAKPKLRKSRLSDGVALEVDATKFAAHFSDLDELEAFAEQVLIQAKQLRSGKGLVG